MSDYEAKRSARVDRMRARAAAKRREADRLRAGLQQKQDVMMGTPVLRGHHSERRHRKDLQRMDRDSSRIVALRDEADELERRATAAESSTAIDSDDPAAVRKLKDKIAQLERQASQWAAVNRAIGRTRYNLTEAQVRRARKRLGELDFLTPALVDAALKPDVMGQLGVPSYRLTNRRAEIRRLKKRLEQLSAQAVAEPLDETVGDVRIAEEQNRVRTYFPAKPGQQLRAELKRAGFCWSPTAGAWQRKPSSRATYEARRIAQLAPRDLLQAVTPSDASRFRMVVLESAPASARAQFGSAAQKRLIKRLRTDRRWEEFSDEEIRAAAQTVATEAARAYSGYLRSMELHGLHGAILETAESGAAAAHGIAWAQLPRWVRIEGIKAWERGLAKSDPEERARNVLGSAMVDRLQKGFTFANADIRRAGATGPNAQNAAFDRMTEESRRELTARNVAVRRRKGTPTGKARFKVGQELWTTKGSFHAANQDDQLRVVVVEAGVEAPRDPTTTTNPLVGGGRIPAPGERWYAVRYPDDPGRARVFGAAYREDQLTRRAPKRQRATKTTAKQKRAEEREAKEAELLRIVEQLGAEGARLRETLKEARQRAGVTRISKELRARLKRAHGLAKRTTTGRATERQRSPGQRRPAQKRALDQLRQGAPHALRVPLTGKPPQQAKPGDYVRVRPQGQRWVAEYVHEDGAVFGAEPPMGWTRALTTIESEADTWGTPQWSRATTAPAATSDLRADALRRLKSKPPRSLAVPLVGTDDEVLVRTAGRGAPVTAIYVDPDGDTYFEREAPTWPKLLDELEADHKLGRPAWQQARRNEEPKAWSHPAFIAAEKERAAFERVAAKAPHAFRADTTDGRWEVLVHPSTKRDGWWQATTFEAGEPIGDMEDADWRKLLARLRLDRIDWANVKPMRSGRRRPSGVAQARRTLADIRKEAASKPKPKRSREQLAMFERQLSFFGGGKRW